MHFGTQLLEPLLVPNTKMLLLIHDDEAEVLESHGLAQDRMRADDDVDAALCEAFLDLAAFRRADHPGELANVDRKAGEALTKVLGMLTSQQSRRRDDCRLLAIDRRGEGGAQRDLGLTEADVAAHQPVHWSAGGQVVQRRLNRARLVRRFVVGKAGAKFVVQAFWGSEAGRRMRHALRSDADEFARHLAHALL